MLHIILFITEGLIIFLLTKLCHWIILQKKKQNKKTSSCYLNNNVLTNSGSSTMAESSALKTCGLSCDVGDCDELWKAKLQAFDIIVHK